MKKYILEIDTHRLIVIGILSVLIFLLPVVHYLSITTVTDGFLSSLDNYIYIGSSYSLYPLLFLVLIIYISTFKYNSDDSNDSPTILYLRYCAMPIISVFYSTVALSSYYFFNGESITTLLVVSIMPLILGISIIHILFFQMYLRNKTRITTLFIRILFFILVPSFSWIWMIVVSLEMAARH